MERSKCGKTADCGVITEMANKAGIIWTDTQQAIATLAKQGKELKKEVIRAGVYQLAGI